MIQYLLNHHRIFDAGDHPSNHSGRAPALIASLNINSEPALHGGAVGAFLEIAAQIELAWMTYWPQMEQGATGPRAMPKTIDFTIDYLRMGLPRDAYARATVNRSGRRYASVHVEAWQDNRNKLFAQATGHFLMPTDD